MEMDEVLATLRVYHIEKTKANHNRLNEFMWNKWKHLILTVVILR